MASIGVSGSESRHTSCAEARVVCSRSYRFGIASDCPAEPCPELLVADADQAGELIVAAHHVETESGAFHAQPAGLVEEPAYRLIEPARVHRVGPALVTNRGVDLVAAEQLLFHLSAKRGSELHVSAVVGPSPAAALSMPRWAVSSATSTRLPVSTLPGHLVDGLAMGADEPRPDPHRRRRILTSRG